MPTPTKKPNQFTPKPAQPLTEKRRKAITKYCQIKYDANMIGGVATIVENAIKADRMPAENLYKWLERHGYTYEKKYWRLKK